MEVVDIRQLGKQAHYHNYALVFHVEFSCIYSRNVPIFSQMMSPGKGVSYY